MDRFISYIGMGIILIIVLILVFIGVGAIGDIIFGDFHIYNYVDMSSTKYRGDISFIISDRKEFKGSYAYHYLNSNTVLFHILNSAKHPYNFKDASFFVLDENWIMYKLKLLSIASSDFGEGSAVLNPNGSINISCELPIGSLNASSKIIGFKISGRDIATRFGYLPRPYWKEYYEDTIKPFCKKLSQGYYK